MKERPFWNLVIFHIGCFRETVGDERRNHEYSNRTYIITGFAQLENCTLAIDENGLVSDIFNMNRLEQKSFPSNTIRIDLQGDYIIPGLFDSHIHGFGGYGTEDCSVDSSMPIICPCGRST